MKVTMMMLGGPYSGQEVKAPPPRWTKGYREVPYLVNVWSGSEIHCYLTRLTPAGNWYLYYQESF